MKANTFPNTKEADAVRNAGEPPSTDPPQLPPPPYTTGGIAMRGLLTIQQVQTQVFEPEARPSIRTLRTWTKNRLLPSIKLGHRVFYRLHDVNAALTARTRGGVR